MRRISPHDWPQLLKDIHAFFGADVLTGAPQTTGVSIHEIRRTAATVHPLAFWWRDLEKNVDLFLRDSKLLRISPNSARLLELYVALQEIMYLKNVDRILSDIRIPSKFYSAAFEALLAAMYVSRGYRIEIAVEGEREGVKSCDFIVNTLNGRVNIEAKSLDDLSREENRHLEMMASEICALMQRERLCALVSIVFSRHVAGRECSHVVRQLAEAWQQSKSAASFLIRGTCRVNVTTLGQWGIAAPLSFPASGHEKAHVFYQCEVITTTNNAILAKNPQIVTTLPYFSPDISARVLKQVRRASRQLRADEASIVHVLLPYMTGRTFLDAVDSSYTQVYRKLQKDYKRINCVYLSGQLYSADYRFGPIQYHHYLVPNGRPKSVFPSDFNFLFVDRIIKEPLLEEGSVIVPLKLFTALHEQKARNIFWSCSKDGRSQVRMWTTDEGRLRAELVCSAHGRVFCEASVKADAGDHVLVLTWGKGEIRLYLDAEDIGVSNL